jgi:hypothetical protein
MLRGRNLYAANAEVWHWLLPGVKPNRMVNLHIMKSLRAITPSLRAPMLLILIAAVVLVAACRSDDKAPDDLTAIYDTITFYPGSTIDGGPVAPATLVLGHMETFVNDRRMFLASSSTTKDEVLDYYAKEIPKLGWEKEDPPDPQAEDMQNYCAAGFVTCHSYIKDDVRMIISAPIQLQLNPISTQGVSYHFHLERA